MTDFISRNEALVRAGVEEAHKVHDREAELHRTYFEAASKSAETAVRTSVLVNGGAAAAVLALIGGMVSQKLVTVKQVADVAGSLMYFASGVAAGIMALAFIYLMRYSEASNVGWKQRISEPPYVVETDRSRFMRHVFTSAHVIAVGVSLLSVVLFIFGVVEVKNAIMRLAGVAAIAAP